jgi:hypothetical protein
VPNQYAAAQASPGRQKSTRQIRQRSNPVASAQGDSAPSSQAVSTGARAPPATIPEPSHPEARACSDSPNTWPIDRTAQGKTPACNTPISVQAATSDQ